MEGSGEEAAPQWGVGDEADTEFAGSGHHVVFDVAGPDAPFALYRGDGVYAVGCPEFVGGDFGKPDVPHFPFGHEFGHGGDGFFDGAGEFAAVHVVEVDVVDAESA